MKKLLIIVLLFWGCEDTPTEHTHEGVCVERLTQTIDDNTRIVWWCLPTDELRCQHLNDKMTGEGFNVGYTITGFSYMTSYSDCEELCEEVNSTLYDFPDTCIVP